MTALRLLGLILGCLLFVFLFNRFRHGRLKRFDFALGCSFALGLASVSAWPQLVTLLRDMLALEQAQFSRLIAIGILSNIALWLLLLHLRYQRGSDRDQFDMLLRRLVTEEFRRDYPRRLPLSPLVVIIPAYNEAENISSVLASLPERVAGKSLQALVVDDGSDDGTAEIAGAAGAFVVASPVRRGGGAALRLGFAVADRFGAEIVVTMDGDGQHRGEDITNLVEPILEDRFDFVIGSRLLGSRERDSRVRLLGIHVFGFVLRLFTPVRISDCSNGFRALRLDQLRRVLLRQDQYHTTELIIDAARKGVRLGEAPVMVKRRLSGESKKGRNWKYGFNFAKTIVKTWWREP